MSAVGEAALSHFIQLLFDSLSSLVLPNDQDQELKKWKSMLLKIYAVLDDAEEKQMTNRFVKIWLNELRDLAYNMEDILDEITTESLQRKLMEESQASASKIQKLLHACFTKLKPSAVMFNIKMVSKIKEITSRLQDIETQRSTLDLRESAGGMSTRVWQRPQSTCLPNEPEVFGRDGDKKKILELLLRNEPRGVNYCVIPIVGMGGLGKTTLARLVYNDEAVQHFDLKAWVCVSEEFDIMRITKALLESITSQSCDVKELNQVQVQLQNVLVGKKFLLVLDDVWNKNYGLWEALRTPFTAGATGSKIIVTTRSEDVGLMMGPAGFHKMELLSGDDCWFVFKKHAFEYTDIGAHPKSEWIREKVTEKCKGLPLAARTLGGLLRFKQRHDEWENILNSEIWNLLDDECDILPVLRLSYYHLPSHLKRCFTYCAIFPKDYEFEEQELILLWMAEGLIQQPKENKQTEDLGREYFHDLLSRSLFQPSSGDKLKFLMHDLINDLAQSVAGETCFRLEGDSGTNMDSIIFEKARHSSYLRNLYDGVNKFEAFYKVKYLRTFLPIRPKSYSLPFGIECSYLTHKVPLDLLPKLRCLRVLSLSGYNISKLPDSIGDLKHLRYLNLSCTLIMSLPETTSTLYNLQTLILKKCSFLKNLPSNMGNLINLHHLDITDTDAMEEMPLGLDQLRSLRTLSDFVVGKDTGSRITMLMNLKFLQGALRISRMDYIYGAQDAMEANIKDKDLNELSLEWVNDECHGSQSDSLNDESPLDDLSNEGSQSDDRPNEGSHFDGSQNKHVEEVLRKLQPPQKLKALTIKCYGSTKFPTWVGDPSFSSMVQLWLGNCKNCTSLPPVGQLPTLKDLVIKGMSSVKSVGPEFYGDGKPFPSLETLHFEDMQQWEEWNPCGVTSEEFLHLRELCIKSCPKLSAKLPSHLPSLAKLVIHGCEKLLVSIPILPMLCELEIKGCNDVVDITTIDLSSQNSSVVSNVSKLTCLTEGFMRGLTRVEGLKIVGCKVLTFLGQNEVGLQQCLTSLRQLEIEDCPKLVSLVEEEKAVPEGLVCALESLKLRKCKRLEKLPQWLSSFTKLKEIKIENCSRLHSFPRDSLPSRLRVVWIKNCKAVASLATELIHNSMYLEELTIEGCGSLKSFGRGQLSPSLKKLTIKSCKNLQWLLEEGDGPSSSLMMLEENVNSSSKVFSSLQLYIALCPSLISLLSRGELPTALELINIFNCPKLTSLTSGGKLPARLKVIKINKCAKLEAIRESFHSNTSLETIEISCCENFKFLPESLHNHKHLRVISIFNCPNFVSFPEGGLPTTNFRSLSITKCENLKALPNHMHNLTTLQHLNIGECGVIVSLPEEGLPTYITELWISDPNICKLIFEWGLHRFTSLRQLIITDACVVSFPLEETGMILPSSLHILSIARLWNLEYLSSKGFQNLTSLENLQIFDCPKLRSLPEKLPPSLLELCINACPLLKKRCEEDRGQDWFKIKHIPCVTIDGIFIYGPER